MTEEISELDKDKENELIEKCANWVKKVQNPDGGLPSDNEGSYSCTWSTSGLLWAAWTASCRKDGRTILSGIVTGAIHRDRLFGSNSPYKSEWGGRSR